MKSLICLVAATSLACTTQPAPRAAGGPAAVVGPDAVWTPPADFRAAFPAACEGTAGDLGACFLQQMEKAGAPRAAVDFARRTGGQGYLTGFRETGVVDVAYAEYPFRANENRGVLLVNGQPATIDVDDPALVDAKTFAGDTVYAALRRGTSNLLIFPGERADTRAPRVLSRPDGGHRFVVTYKLTDGCHACKVLGDAYVAFEFDARGKFEGVTVVRVQPRYR